VVFVFDFSLGQSRCAGNRPIHGLLAAVDHSLFDERRERTKDVGFVRGIFRFVLVLPVGKDAEAQELSALFFDEFGREFGALFAQLRGVDRTLLLADHFHNLVLNRQSVAVPPRDVRRFETLERLVAQNYVFEDFVKSRTDVHVAVREGRSVVQNELGMPRILFLDASVEVGLFPVLDARGFAFYEVAAHRELGVGKIESVFEVFFRHFVVCLNLS